MSMTFARHGWRSLASVATLGRCLVAISAICVGISVAGCAGEAPEEAAAWSPLHGPRGFITSLAVSPAKPEIIYATVRDRGLFRSTDGGRTWRRPANTGLPPTRNAQGAPIVGKYSAYAVAVHPDVPMTVYAISGDSSEVVKSMDGGRRWRVTEESNSVNGLAINPQNPAIVYAAGWGGVDKTTDGGRTWRHASAGLPEDFLTDVWLDPQRPERLYVGTEDGDLWTTVNGGRAWRVAGSPGFFDEVLALAIDPHEPETIYAGTLGPVSLRARTAVSAGKLPTPVCQVRVRLRTMRCLCMRSR